MKQSLSPAVIVIVIVIVLAVVGVVGWKVLGGAGQQKVTDEGAPVPMEDASPGLEQPGGGETPPPAMPPGQATGGG